VIRKTENLSLRRIYTTRATLSRALRPCSRQALRLLGLQPKSSATAPRVLYPVFNAVFTRLGVSVGSFHSIDATLLTAGIVMLALREYEAVVDIVGASDGLTSGIGSGRRATRINWGHD